MDTPAQLGELIGSLLVPVLILVIIVWPLVITWLVVRAFRDLHMISRALWAIHHAIQQPAHSAPVPLPAPPQHAGKVAMSQFGR